MRTHKQWLFFLSLPILLLKRLQTFYENDFFSPKLLPFCIILPKQPTAFPQVLLPKVGNHSCSTCVMLATSPLWTLLSLQQGKVLGKLLCAARIWAALQAHSTPPSAFTGLICPLSVVLDVIMENPPAIIQPCSSGTVEDLHSRSTSEDAHSPVTAGCPQQLPQCPRCRTRGCALWGCVSI